MRALPSNYYSFKIKTDFATTIATTLCLLLLLPACLVFCAASATFLATASTIASGSKTDWVTTSTNARQRPSKSPCLREPQRVATSFKNSTRWELEQLLSLQRPIGAIEWSELVASVHDSLVSDLGFLIGARSMILHIRHLPSLDRNLACASYPSTFEQNSAQNGSGPSQQVPSR